MAYVYRKTKSRAGLAAAKLARPVEPQAAVEEPAVESVELEPKPAKVPGRKRGPGRNNKNGSGCGTNNGYWAHKRAGEDVCAPCIRAHREYNKAAGNSAQGRRAA